jgi:hypothetical protein
MTKLFGEIRVGILRLIGSGLLSAVMLATFSNLASAAPLTWSLQDVTFGDGATATGSFAPYSSGYSSWSITTSAEGSFTAFTFTPGTSTAASCCDDDLQLTSNDGTRILNLEFNDSTSGGASPQNVAGTETIPDDERRVTSGEMILTGQQSVPEPGSLLLFTAGGLVLFLQKLRARG